MAEPTPIVPVVFFGTEDRFMDDPGMQQARRKDFRPRPIVPQPEVKEEQSTTDDAPKASSATEPAPASPDGSQTSPSGSEGTPAGAVKENPESLEGLGLL